MVRQRLNVPQLMLGGTFRLAVAAIAAGLQVAPLRVIGSQERISATLGIKLKW